MLTQRQLLILEAIVRDYTDVGQPIGSKTLQQQLPVHVSSATIRNEMQVLEKRGYLAKPHHSAGRVPSLQGYRYYVDNLLQPAKVDQGQLAQIKHSLTANFQRVDEIIAASANMLSELTNYTAISLKPDAKKFRLEGFRAVPLGNQQVMVLLVTSDGNVQNQVFTLPPGVSGEELEASMRVLNDHVAGLPLSQVVQQLHQEVPYLQRYLRDPDGFLQVFNQLLTKVAKDQFFVGGKLNMLNYANVHDVEQLKQLYTLFDSKINYAKLLQPEGDAVSVKIAQKLSDQLKVNYSVVSATYEMGEYGHGLIAILGPTNMSYAKMIGLVGAFRKELTRKMLDYYRKQND